MTALPASIAFTDSAVTEGEFKTAITNQREFLAGLLGTSGNTIDALQAIKAFANDVSAKTGAYTVLAADRGVVFECSGTFTLSLTAASTLGDGFVFSVINTGSGVITIDPNSTEQIDGASTKTVEAGSWAIVICNGTSFRSMGAVPATGALIGYQVFTSSGTYTKATNNPSFVIVEVAGGGGGAGYSLNGAGVGGGGGGGYSRQRILASSLAASETVTVGTGGAGGTNGTNGGTGNTSSFGAFCSATGGAGGISNANTNGSAAGGNGGVGSGGDINITGQRGGFGIGGVAGGSGGASLFSGGTNSGSGGNGRITSGNGLAGNAGIVIVWEYK